MVWSLVERLKQGFHSSVCYKLKMDSKVVILLFGCFSLLVGTSNSLEANVMEGYFVLDKKALEKYQNENPNTALMEALQDLMYFVNLANERLSQLKDFDLDIQLKMLKTEVQDDLFTKVDQDNVVPNDHTLESFNGFLETTDAKNRIGFDFAVLLTGYDLASDTAASRKGTICSDERDDESQLAIAVVEFDGTPLVTDSLLRHIGFLLGALDDGSASKNIMRDFREPKDPENFFFSKCSAFDIKEYLATISHECLHETSPKSTTPNISPEIYSGKLLDPDALCARSHGPGSLACRSPSLYGTKEISGDKLCTKIYCRSSVDENICSGYWIADGMTCDTDKVCRLGKCISDTTGRASQTQSGCAFGNQAVLSDGNSCEQAFAEEGSGKCYNRDFRESCCTICAAQKTRNPDCRYGDRFFMVGKNRASCSDYLHLCNKNTVITESCCQSCSKSGVGKREAATEGSATTYAQEDEIIPVPDDDRVGEVAVHVEEEPITKD